MSAEVPSRENGWRRLHLPALVRLTQHGDLWRRWVWREIEQDGRKALALVAPSGRVWRFKLNRGAWLKEITGGEKERET